MSGEAEERFRVGLRHVLGILDELWCGVWPYNYLSKRRSSVRWVLGRRWGFRGAKV